MYRETRPNGHDSVALHVADQLEVDWMKSFLADGLGCGSYFGVLFFPAWSMFCFVDFCQDTAWMPPHVKSFAVSNQEIGSGYEGGRKDIRLVVVVSVPRSMGFAFVNKEGVQVNKYCLSIVSAVIR